jgi:hypothetical protein
VARGCRVRRAARWRCCSVCRALTPPAVTTEQPAEAGSPNLSAWVGRYWQGKNDVIEIRTGQQGLMVRALGREMPAKAQGALRLLVGGDSDQGTALTLVPDDKGQPAYVSVGGRAYRRLN